MNSSWGSYIFWKGGVNCFFWLFLHLSYNLKSRGWNRMNLVIRWISIVLLSWLNNCLLCLCIVREDGTRKKHVREFSHPFWWRFLSFKFFSVIFILLFNSIVRLLLLIQSLLLENVLDQLCNLWGYLTVVFFEYLLSLKQYRVVKKIIRCPLYVGSYDCLTDLLRERRGGILWGARKAIRVWWRLRLHLVSSLLAEGTKAY